jgi:hypothetical protein
MKDLIVARVVVLAIAFSIVPLTSAFASPAQSMTQLEEHLAYPASPAVFRERVNDRVAKARARVEQFILDEEVSPETAKKVRARFEAAIAQIHAKVDEVCADGTVTAEEAIAVHELARTLRHRS